MTGRAGMTRDRKPDGAGITVGAYGIRPLSILDSCLRRNDREKREWRRGTGMTGWKGLWKFYLKKFA